MLAVVLVIVVVAGASILYVIARRVGRVDQTAALALAGTGALTSVVAAFLASFLGTPSGSGAIALDSKAAPLTAVSPSPEVASPTPGAIPLAAARKLVVTGGLVQGGVETATFSPAGAGSWNWGSHTLRLSTSASATMTGWAADVDRKSPYSGIIGIVDDKVFVTATYFEDRLDVARQLLIPGIRYCGFQIRLSGIPRGNHVLTLGAVNKEGTAYTLMSRPIKLIVS
jgi:hypothetical protein